MLALMADGGPSTLQHSSGPVVVRNGPGKLWCPVPWRGMGAVVSPMRSVPPFAVQAFALVVAGPCSCGTVCTMTACI